MILYMYTHYHKKHKCSSAIQFDDHEPKVHAQIVKRACEQAELTKIKEAKRLCKYIYLGFYDDETMKFKLLDEPEILFDFDDYIQNREVYEAEIKEAAGGEKDESILEKREA